MEKMISKGICQLLNLFLVLDITSSYPHCYQSFFSVKSSCTNLEKNFFQNHQIRKELLQKLAGDALSPDKEDDVVSTYSGCEDNSVEDEDDPIGDFEDLGNFINAAITTEEVDTYCQPLMVICEANPK